MRPITVAGTPNLAVSFSGSPLPLQADKRRPRAPGRVPTPLKSTAETAVPRKSVPQTPPRRPVPHGPSACCLWPQFERLAGETPTSTTLHAGTGSSPSALACAMSSRLSAPGLTKKSPGLAAATAADAVKPTDGGRCGASRPSGQESAEPMCCRVPHPRSAHPSD